MQRIGRLGATLETLVGILMENFFSALDGKAGGWFCLFSPLTKKPLPGYHFSVGIVSLEKSERYKILSVENAFRLSQRREHVSSWQSRKPEYAMYGGAARGNTYLFSFSGLPELFDEAVAVASAFIHEETDLERLFTIIKESENPYAERLIELYNAHHATGAIVFI